MKRCTILEASHRRLTAVLRGEKYDPARHRIRMEIKAATYHQASIRRMAAGWIGRVVFDV